MTRTRLLVVVLAVLGMLALVVVGLPGTGAAQTVSSGYSSISPGPGGVWVLRGNRLYVCELEGIREGTRPPTPRCGSPLARP